jgi:hypothetical protein
MSAIIHILSKDIAKIATSQLFQQAFEDDLGNNVFISSQQPARALQ